MIQIFLKMKEQYIKTEMEYPLNFWLMLLSGVVTRFFGMLVPFIIWRQYQNELPAGSRKRSI